MNASKSTRWSAADLPDLTGRRAVITGASSGIGLPAAIGLAAKGATVVLPCRSEAKAARTEQAVRARVPDARVETAVMDLARLSTVHAFAAAQAGHTLDILINNAGTMDLPKRTLTQDGFEEQFGTNVVGHYVLTALLMHALLRTPAPRVVWVSSGAHQMGRIDFANLNGERSYHHWKAYCQSKLADLLIMREMQHRFGDRLTSIGCHPGYARTNLQFDGPTLVMKIGAALFLPFSQTAEAGAEPTLFAAADPGAQPGGYYGPTGLLTMRGPVGPAAVSSAAQDDATAARLFDWLAERTGTRFPEMRP